MSTNRANLNARHMDALARIIITNGEHRTNSSFGDDMLCTGSQVRPLVSHYPGRDLSDVLIAVAMVVGRVS